MTNNTCAPENKRPRLGLDEYRDEVDRVLAEDDSDDEIPSANNLRVVESESRDNVEPANKSNIMIRRSISSDSSSNDDSTPELEMIYLNKLFDSEPCKIGKFELYKYQTCAIELMHRLESAAIDTVYTLGTTGSIDLRKKMMAKDASEWWKVKRLPRLGMLAAPVGSGKTVITLQHLKQYPSPPHERKAVVSNVYSTDELILPRLPINIMVVPSSLYPQWVEHLDAAELSRNWIQIRRAEELTRFVNMCGDIRVKGLTKNVLITVNKYSELLSDKFRFNYLYSVLRVIFDEADLFNVPVLWADFTWLVSATVSSLTKMLTTSFGSSSRGNTMRGSIKMALYSVAQPMEFCINICPELINNELNLRGRALEKYQAKIVYYGGFHTDVYGGRATHLDEYVENYNMLEVNQMLLKIIETVKDINKPAKILCFYYLRPGEDSDTVVKHFAQKGVGNGYKVVRIHNAQSVRQLTKVQQDTRSSYLILINGRLLSEGLNLQFATHLFMTGLLPTTRLIQGIGRAQRQGRTSVLQVYRFLPAHIALIPFGLLSAKEHLQHEIFRLDSKWNNTDNTWSVDAETIEMERLAQMIVDSKRENLMRRNNELKLIN